MRTFLMLFLVFAAPLAAQKIRVKPSPETLACGRDVGFRSDLDEALAEAKRKQRPVFWYVPTVRGSRMDRKPEVDHYMMAGPFSCPEVASLLARRFVPVKAVAAGAAQKRYGLFNLRFVEPGFLVLAPDGEEILRLQKITTFNNEWFLWQVRRALELRPDLAAEAVNVAEARRRGKPEDVARALLEEGDWEGAARALPAAQVEEPPARILLRARIAVGLRRDEEAARLLDRIIAEPNAPPALKAEARVEKGRHLLLQDRPGEALPHFQAGSRQGPRRHEALFFSGVCHHLQGAAERATRIWKKLAASKRQDTWTRKASAEAQRLGPFSRCFERFDRIPREAFLADADGTRWPRRREDLQDVLRRSVRLLLRTQKESGVWDDSNYDFGGTDSLPNVYAAGTALAARALLEFPEIAGKEGDQAVRRAFSYLANEKHLAWDDVDEIVWAHAFRLYLLEKMVADRHPLASRARKKAVEILRYLSRSQLESGSWRHEYPNPFVTAMVLLCLDHAARAGLPTGKGMISKAAEALLLCRGDDGTFTYGMPRKPRRKGRPRRRRPTPAEASAGRMPLCELGLLIGGRSDQAKLRRAIERSFEHHHLLERARKYDDHADRYANGGFFFWHDLLGRTEAIARIEDPAVRRAFKERQLDLILSIVEIDGGFVDSHELGKTYGTAMGLLCLKQLLSLPEN